VLFTGPTQLIVGRPENGCSVIPSDFDVPNGGSSPTFCFVVSDPAGRPLVGGTQIRVETSAGAIGGTVSVDLPDVQSGGRGITYFEFTVVDDDPAPDSEPEDAAVTVSVTSPISATCPGGNGNAVFSFTGTVN
jgi:hypothetical protein